MQQLFTTPPSRWVPFVAIGSACIVAGGLVAAITATSPSEHGAWAAAYLVLVAGVAQVALGLGQAWIATAPPSPDVTLVELVAFNAGNVGVMAGTLLGATWLVDLGGIVLAASLGVFLWATRRGTGGPVAVAYRALAAFVLVSIPVGLVLVRILE
jgi:hypothetical protein